MNKQIIRKSLRVKKPGGFLQYGGCVRQKLTEKPAAELIFKGCNV